MLCLGIFALAKQQQSALPLAHPLEPCNVLNSSTNGSLGWQPSGIATQDCGAEFLRRVHMAIGGVSESAAAVQVGPE